MNGLARGGLIAAAVALLALNLRTVIASLPPLLGQVRDDLGLSAAAAGLLTTVPVACFGALSPLVPRLARRVRLERILIACAAVTAIAAGARGAGTTAMLFVASVLAGCAVAIAQGALPALIRLRWERLTGGLMGAYSMALPLGATLAAAAAVPLERALGDSWQRSLAAWAVPALAASVTWAWIARTGGTRLEAAAPPRLRAHPLAWSVALYFGTQSAGFYAGLAWIPEILQSAGYTESTAGALLAVSAFVSMVPALTVPMVVARRADQRAVLLALVATAAAGVGGLLVAPDAAPAWVVLIGFGQGGMLGLALMLPVLRARTPEGVAALTGMSLFVGYLVASTGPWVLGVAHDLSGDWSLPLAAMLVITLAQVPPGLHSCRDVVLR